MDRRSEPVTDSQREKHMKELSALRERVRYLEEMEKEFAALARELKHSEERNRLLMDKSLDGIFIAQDEVVKFPNRSMTELTGHTARELAAIPFSDLIRSEDRERVLLEYRRVLGGSSSGETLCFGAIRKDGNVFPAEVRAVPITWEERPAVLCLMRDATAQANLESQLQYAKKMEAVGTLAGGIAHDFNNHLQAISGYIQLLMLRGDRDRTEQGWLAQIERCVQRAAALTKQILIFSRREEVRFDPLDLNEVVRQAQKTLARTIPESISAELRLAADLNSIDGDAVQIEHVLFNLGIHAKEAMPADGRIVIETRNVRLDDMFCRTHEGMNPGIHVELAFTDTGHGMSRESRERIFEPFHTAKAAGSEIGLAVVYAIVRSHRGLIFCESNRDAGTTFRIYLPALRQDRPASAKEARKKREFRGIETILIVDDEPDILDIGQSTLEQFGYTALTARSGEEAVEVYSRQTERINLVILDLGMPGMGGDKCLKELLRLNPSVKVLIASGYAATQTVQSVMEAGAAGFMAKPYRLEDMLKKVRDVLEGGGDQIPMEDS
jgi:two-component system cell cycle sensor histidine kinase/response regulator CckA